MTASQPPSTAALALNAISKLVARRFRDRCYVHKNLPPLQLPPQAILANRAAVMAKLAEAGARAATDGPCWGYWLACADAAGGSVGAAVGQLLEHEAHWLASWCWLTGHDELGVAAYEQLLASKRALGTDDGTETYYNRIGFNHFATFSFIVGALRLGLETRALRALEPVCEALGSCASDDILLALLRYQAGTLDRAGARKVIARFAHSTTDLDHAARAIALQELGDEAAARAVVAGFDRETSVPPTAAQELAKRFGSGYAQAIARARPARPKRTHSPGYVVVPSRAKSPHAFAPDVPRGPACPGWASVAGLVLLRSREGGNARAQERGVAPVPRDGMPRL